MYKFGSFALLPADKQLLRDGAPVALAPKVFETLLVLVESQGRLLKKAEFLKRVWPDSFVEEVALAHAISQLRKALRTPGEDSDPIETVPKHGYRFKLRVETAGAEAGDVPAHVTVAVLPFENLSASAEREYLADGLTEELIAVLGQIDPEHLRVIGRTSTMAYKRSSKPLTEIGRELGAKFLVESSIRGEGSRLRVTSKLIRVLDQVQTWAASYDSRPDSVLEFQRELSTAIADQVRLRLSPQRLDGMAHRQTRHSDAYDLYLRGRTAMHGGSDAAMVQSAIVYYQDALKKDPRFALGYAGLADASLRMYNLRKETVWAEKALAAAQQALRLNENLAEVHFALGSVYNATGKTAEAAAELKHALELAPNSDEGYRRLADNYLATNRNEEAIRAYQKAVQINPYYWVNQNALGSAYFQLGDLDKALSSFRKVTELEPDNPTGQMNVGAVEFREGRYSDSLPAFQKALQLQPSADIYSNLGTAYFFLKRYADAVTEFEKAVQMNPNDEVNVGNLADAYRWSGRKEQAAATYDKAIALAYKELRVNPRSAGTQEHLALYYAKKGDSAQALEFIHRARALDPDNTEVMYSEGVVQALAHHADEAQKALREAFEKGYSAEEAKNDPELDSLRSSPEFESLLKQFSGKTK